MKIVDLTLQPTSLWFCTPFAIIKYVRLTDFSPNNSNTSFPLNSTAQVGEVRCTSLCVSLVKVAHSTNLYRTSPGPPSLVRLKDNSMVRLGQSYQCNTTQPIHYGTERRPACDRMRHTSAISHLGLTPPVQRESNCCWKHSPEYAQA